MYKQPIAFGILVFVLFAQLLIKEQWFLDQTLKGQRLVRWFGPVRAVMVLRGIALSGMLFAILLATGVIRPIQW